MNATNHQISMYGCLILANVMTEPVARFFMLGMALYSLYKYVTVD